MSQCHSEPENIEKTKKCLEENLNVELIGEINKNYIVRYLDEDLIKIDNIIKPKWIKKNVTSNRLINFNSFQDIDLKKNVLINRLNKMIMITDLEYLDENLDIIIKEFKNNGYQWNLIKNIIKSTVYNDNKILDGDLKS